MPEGLKVSLTSVVLPESRVSLFDSKSGSSMGTTRSNVRSLVIDVESLGQKHVYQNTPNRRSNGGFLFIVRPKTKLHYWRAVHPRSSWSARDVNDDILEPAEYNRPADSGLNVARVVPKLEIDMLRRAQIGDV